jgi:molybdenum-dependent DNA-binding transcriptional regulator ModE
METSKLKLIAEFTNGRAVGPGKIQLLEAIEKAGSISQARSAFLKFESYQAALSSL